MSTFEKDNYRWRETYFVLFDSGQRPTLAKVEKLLGNVHAHFELQEPRGDEEGLFESVTVLAANAYAALDISFLSGEEVLEQGGELAETLADHVEENDRPALNRLSLCDARFDVLHFEEVVDEEGDDEAIFDPSALLIVVEALKEATGGIAVDPQANELM